MWNTFFQQFDEKLNEYGNDIAAKLASPDMPPDLKPRLESWQARFEQCRRDFAELDLEIYAILVDEQNYRYTRNETFSLIEKRLDAFAQKYQHDVMIARLISGFFPYVNEIRPLGRDLLNNPPRGEQALRVYEHDMRDQAADAARKARHASQN